MGLKLLAGQVLGYSYNEIVGKLPSRTLRELYLRAWLGGFGKGTGVQLNCRFVDGHNVFLGQRNVINGGCMFRAQRFRIITGSDVSIGPDAALLTLGHDPQSKHFSDKGGEISVGDRVWICYRAVILPGVTIGEGAVVGAGSVVSRDVEPYSIVAGVPARKVGERNPELDYRLNFRPWLM